MPTLDFPTSPALNEEYTFSGRTWKWNGTAWQVAGGTALNNIVIGNMVPSSATFTTVSTTGNVTVGANISVTSNVTVGANISVTSNASVTGNVSASYFLGNGSLLTGIGLNKITNGTSKIEIATSNANIVATVANTSVLTISTAGIQNNLGNGTGNIGNSTAYWNTIFAKSTSAQYADLAEMYASDKNYEPGTVVSFGGPNEITKTYEIEDVKIAGVVSSYPSYLMNSNCEGEFPLPIALCGKVPTKVRGPVQKGDMMISAGNGHAMACSTPCLGSVIGKAVESFSGAYGIINIVVGRL